MKYQCQAEVPQAEAPCSGSDGKTLERKAESSGHSGLGDCKKKVSIGIVMMRPISTPKMPAGRRALRMKEICDCTELPAVVKRRYALCDANRSTSSDRKMTVASVRR